MLSLEKIAEIEALLGFDFTQEGMEECHARHNVGCKNDECEAQTTEFGWFYLEGDVYCFKCALAMDTELGTESEIIPTRAQAMQRRSLAELGIRWD